MSYTHPKIELLAPAGNFEKLEIAIHYGADAVYLSGPDFSLRNFAGNFSMEELYRGVLLAHLHHVKVYVTCNIYPRNFEESAITGYLRQIGEIQPDAVIIADPGILMEARRIIPHIPVHLSTQANTTSRLSARFWETLGVTRINVARELSLDEIKQIADATAIEIEAFVHGAMCISHSGRCLLSSFMANRDANRGMCTHPCRWNYFLVEETRPGQYMPVCEDSRGSYIFNSKDLCMIGHIPEMFEAGITSFKIEGRLKGLHYLASVVKTYREAIDAYTALPNAYEVAPYWQKELAGINLRGYCTGFYLDDAGQTVPNYENEKPLQQTLFAGKVLAVIDQNWIRLDVRNKLQKADLIEILPAIALPQTSRITEIIDDHGEPSSFVQPEERAIVGLAPGVECSPNDIVRKILTQPE
jgi:U32 family peptidase